MKIFVWKSFTRLKSCRWFRERYCTLNSVGLVRISTEAMVSEKLLDECISVYLSHFCRLSKENEVLYILKVEWLLVFKFELLAHIPFRPDLASSDSYLFAGLKRFGSHEVAIVKTNSYFDEVLFNKQIFVPKSANPFKTMNWNSRHRHNWERRPTDSTPPWWHLDGRDYFCTRRISVKFILELIVHMYHVK